MRFTRAILLTASVAQGLVVPERSNAIAARDAANELGSIVARAPYTCPAKASKQCTVCPKAPTKATTPKGKPTPKPTPKPTCPKGKKCKREEEIEDEEAEEEPELNILEARVEIAMNSIGTGSWKDGEVLETSGLSACSVMAVYDKTKFGMAHIPPAREGSNGQLAATGTDVINEYTAKMTSRAAVATMQQPQGYLLMSSLLDEDKRKLLRDWFRNNNIAFKEQIYAPNNSGSGNLVLSRETKTWPPKVSFA